MAGAEVEHRMTHRTSVSVRFAELDPYNHVNHAVYVTYFEVARTVALTSVGMALGTLNTTPRSHRTSSGCCK